MSPAVGVETTPGDLPVSRPMAKLAAFRCAVKLPVGRPKVGYCANMAVLRVLKLAEGSWPRASIPPPSALNMSVA